MNKYEVYTDRGRVMALDLDAGDIYMISLKAKSAAIDNSKMLVTNMRDEDTSYEIYEEDGDLYLLNTRTGFTHEIVLVPHLES